MPVATLPSDDESDMDVAPRPPAPFRPPAPNSAAVAASAAAAAAISTATAAAISTTVSVHAPPPARKPVASKPAPAPTARKRPREPDDEFEAASDLPSDSSEDSDDENSESTSASGSESDSDQEEAVSTSTVVVASNTRGSVALPPSRAAARDAVAVVKKMSSVLAPEDRMPELSEALEALERFAKSGAGVDSSRIFLAVIQALVATTVDALATARDPDRKMREQSAKIVAASKALSNGYAAVAELSPLVDQVASLKSKLEAVVDATQKAGREAVVAVDGI